MIKLCESSSFTYGLALAGIVLAIIAKTKAAV